MKSQYAGGHAISDRSKTAWLNRIDSSACDDAGLVSSLGRELRGAGLLIDGLVFHVATLHPDLFARVIAWSPHEPVKIYERDHPVTVSAGFPESPFRNAAHRQENRLVPLAAQEFKRWPVDGLFGKSEMSEPVLAPIRGWGGRTVVVSFWVVQPMTFGPRDHVMFAHTVALMQQDRRWREEFGLGIATRADETKS
jgi:hypothetical protein